MDPKKVSNLDDTTKQAFCTAMNLLQSQEVYLFNLPGRIFTGGTISFDLSGLTPSIIDSSIYYLQYNAANEDPSSWYYIPSFTNFVFRYYFYWPTETPDVLKLVIYCHNFNGSVSTSSKNITKFMFYVIKLNI